MLSKMNLRFFSNVKNKTQQNHITKTFIDKLAPEISKKYCSVCGKYAWCNDCKKFISCHKCNENLFYTKCKKLYCNNTCGGTCSEFS